MTTDTHLKKKCLFVDSDKNTFLHEAAAFGNLEKVKKLIAEKHKIDPENYLGWTPLMMAARNGHLEIVNFLLDNRANSTHCNRFGFSVLLIGVSSGRIELFHLILQHVLKGGVSWRCMETTFSPISLAVLFNNAEMVQHLLQYSFCINAINNVTDITPLSFAKVVGNPEIINLLLSKGAQMTVDSKSSASTPNSPLLPLLPIVLLQSPDGQYLPMQSHHPFVPRKCSDLLSPGYSPNVSPITPAGMVPQIFFPSNFTPRFIPTEMMTIGHPDVFNVSVHSPFFSPNMCNQTIPHPYAPQYGNFKM